MQQATRGGPTNLSLHINLEDDTDESVSYPPPFPSLFPFSLARGAWLPPRHAGLLFGQNDALALC